MEVGMYSLDKVVSLVEQWKPSQQKGRDEIVKGLADLIRRAEEARSVWQEYLAAPGPEGNHFALMSWVGPQRAKRLHEINLEAKATLRRIAALAGPAAGRFADLDEEPIEMAYRQIGPDETGPQAAQAAVEKLNARIRYFQAVRERIAKAPVAKDAPRAAAKKKVAKKAAKRPAAAKSKAKPVARKKAPKKK
jgi:hypothetical protein